MKITDIQIVPFRTHADRFRNGQSHPRSELTQTLTRIVTDEGAEGYYLGGGAHGDQEGLSPDDRAVLLGRIRSLLVGQDPLDRELIWKWFWVANINENLASVVDLALWDLAGRVTGLPAYKLMGGARDRVKAYASTYPNVGSPQVYADHALACKYPPRRHRRGSRACAVADHHWRADPQESHTSIGRAPPPGSGRSDTPAR